MLISDFVISMNFMKIKIFNIALVIIILPYIGLASHENYFTALKNKQKIPKGAQAINALSTPKLKHILSDIRKDIPLPYQIKDGLLTDHMHQQYLAFKENFSNQKYTEILFLQINSGSANTSKVDSVFQYRNKHWHHIDFNKLIKKNLLSGKDMSSFYLYTATPFAYQKKNKVYIRYLMLPPYNHYISTDIHVCSYLWVGNRLSLVGDNRNCIKD